MSTHIVPVIKIEQVLPHPNADRLELVPVGGWYCAVKKGDFSPGDRAIYIEPDFMVPVTRPEFAFLKDPNKLDQTHARIRAMRLRGHMSYGLLIPVPVDTTGDYIYSVGDNVLEDYDIHRWQPPEVSSMRTGFSVPEIDVPPCIRGVGKFDIENFNNYPDLIDLGNEPVVITEKIHGANARYCYFDGEFFVGSRSRWLRRPTDSELAEGHRLDAWHKVATANPGIYEWCKHYPGAILYGEIFGNVQDLKYGRQNSVDFAAFAAIDTYDRTWVPFSTLKRQCEVFQVETVPLLGYGVFTRSNIEDLIESDSQVYGAPAGHMMEGVVITPFIERQHPSLGRVSLKLISNRYWTRKL